MDLLYKILAFSKEAGSRIVHPVISVFSDDIVDYIYLQTKYKYGNISFQLRKDKTSGEQYLIIEHRSPEGVIWVPLTKDDANRIEDFLSKNFKD
ncbi:hypothetical protein [Ensifer sp.]|uniref:hypothetical protein n=1 Tax=Ensifer sp. TaxID=1872086 RepID=UPI00289DAE79|nr:hypothetical protein [Ensifer sp.]